MRGRLSCVETSKPNPANELRLSELILLNEILDFFWKEYSI